MESWQCVLLLTAITLRPCSADGRKTDDGNDPVSFLRNIYSGLLVRAEPFLRDSELKELRRPLDLAVIRQTKDKQLSQSDGPVVFTKNGRIKGVTVEKAHIFYGVPYADPPVGAYRWKPPRPVSPWSGVYDASFPRAVSEDCLYLNIFVPLSLNFTSPLLRPLPVMVWIHGGDFIAGSASKPMYDGRFISNFTHTVVVNLEYRLGAFGFLVSGKDPLSTATGNYGILDQQAALFWVQQNIATFGGDPSKASKNKMNVIHLWWTGLSISISKSVILL
uniref:Si:ch73-89b15.3 n=1 Tax=Fundulus heteroclitus TaxID=8078 RepID=A0A3Q2QQF8_FUNHE